MLLEPSDSDISNGVYQLSLPVPPVSLQATSSVRSTFMERIREHTREFPYIFTGCVSVRVEWLCDSEKRIMTDGYGDVDNILKPILDGLSGITGVMVDDSQVQHVDCSWLGGFDYERTNIYVEYDPDFVSNKKNLVFFQIEGPQYMAFNIHKNMSSSMAYELYLHIISMFKVAKESSKRQNMDYYALQPAFIPRFHITKLKRSGFSCIKKDYIKPFLIDTLPA